ncbi:MAG: hypothetical protein J0I84_16950 [Terrimonas sp.]|uniref:hypothetical protein n=1 Tax=Terrimonas sp. TaxID=1914338 RepID=UPI000A5565E8|nr:hypothetical protein [Terrimonas sp.]MBN8788776.1 hypothetical protein [Terrimonas sp.]
MLKIIFITLMMLPGLTGGCDRGKSTATCGQQANELHDKPYTEKTLLWLTAN